MTNERMSNGHAFIGGFVLAVVILSIVTISVKRVSDAQEDLRTKCNPVAAGEVTNYDGSLDDLCGESYSQFINKPKGNDNEH